MNRNGKRIPSQLEDIPKEYAAPCKEPGTPIELYYDTYESMTYDRRSKVLRKRAFVYLPFGYSDEKKYNIYYMMHGGTCNEATIIGTPGNEKAFKNQIDHGVMNGNIQPLIIVIPTYNNLSSSDSYNFELALKLTNNYHNELVNDLIPAMEYTYNGMKAFWSR